MRIGFDGKRMTQNFTGLGNYSRYLVRLLTKFYPENYYNSYAIKAPSTKLLITGVNYKYPGSKSIKSYWRSLGIIQNLKSDNIDVFHGLSNEIPFGLKNAGIQSVVTVHDLIFIRYPEYYALFDRIIYKLKLRYAISSADKIIAISNQTRKDLIHYFNVESDRIKVIYQNCDPIFFTKASVENKHKVQKKYNLPERYILNVGTIEERKNLLLVIKALKDIKDIHLVVVGKDTPYSTRVKSYIMSHDLQQRVHFIKNADHSDLPAIYQSAQLFVYPSRFEGFGIPIVEALHSGIPVIAATGSCLEEAGGPGSIYIDPDDEASLARQINMVLGNSEQRNRMIRAGYDHVKNFSDEKIATEVIEVYKEVLTHA